MIKASRSYPCSEFCRKFGDDQQCDTGSVQLWSLYPSKHHPVTWTYPVCENSLGEESMSISAAEFTTLEFVGQKYATNFTSWFAFPPYKLQIIQEFTAAHRALCIRCCQEILHTHDNLGSFLTWDEATFSLNGSITNKTAHIARLQIHERPLQCPQVVMWCAISAQEITGPYFFEDDDSVSVTVNAERYNHMLETLLRRMTEWVFFKKTRIFRGEMRERTLRNIWKNLMKWHKNMKVRGTSVTVYGRSWGKWRFGQRGRRSVKSNGRM